jgi:NADH dehydrogenase
MAKSEQDSTHVVIVGGGFAGLNAAKVLGKNSSLRITLVDRRNHHLFQPLLYQVATAGLSPAEIASPIRSVLAGNKNTEVFMGEVTGVDLKSRKVVIEGSPPLSYDYLVLACGANHSYFGHEDWENFAPGLKTLEQATEIRRRVLLAFEQAEKESNPEKKKELLTFIVVGAGPTGVELAGAISEISRYSLERDFRNIDPSRTRVILIEAGPRILASFSPELSKRAARDLEKLGVQIWTSSRVTHVGSDGVQLGNEGLRAATVVWAAGVQPSTLGKSLGVPLDRVGRVIVQKDLSIAGHPEVFVLGDQACFESEEKALPGLAPVAIQQGRHAALNIVKTVAGKPRDDFKYLDKGQLATIGRKLAVLQFGKFQMGGFLAWLTWLFVHIFYLIGFKNRVFVFLQWTWSYFTFRRGARLIMDKDWRHKD